MRAAAQSRQVPLAVVEATAYVNTRWEWISTPALDGGVGPMNVRPAQMSLAVSLSGHSQADIDNDPAANLDAGAALLAHYHASGTDLASWRPALVTVQGPYVTNQIYAVINSGASRTTSTGESISLAPQNVTAAAAPQNAAGTASASASSCSAPSPDYGGSACWVPADPSNYSAADRAHDYPIDMIVIHDIEGSYGSAIQEFQTPNYAASAHYVVSYGGDVTQMVREKDIAWHAGNWDYNTRAIGIEHEGFAWTPGLYTPAEYSASAMIAASICSRWGVQLDRTHVIGHNEVPDPNNPGLYGGSDHHTDPGPYWDWNSYMQQAQNDAKSLPSPPHMMPDPSATSPSGTSATVTWQAARTCRPSAAPITGYTVVIQPGGTTQTLPPTATSATFTGLQEGATYTFTVTATNSYGTDSATSSPLVVGACTGVNVTASPTSPQLAGSVVTVTASATGCPNPVYHFGIEPPGATSYQLAQDYSSSPTYSWKTSGLASGTYRFSVWARDASSAGTHGSGGATWDAFDNNLTYTLNSIPCTSVGVSVSPASPSGTGTAVTVTAHAYGCPSPQYHFGIMAPGATSYQLAQDYSSSGTYVWKTSGLASGTYRLSVWARDASSQGTYGYSGGRWDAYDNNTTYQLTSPACSSVSVTATPASPAGTGTSVSITAHAVGCPNPQYHFGILAPGGSSYQLAQDYSTSNTYTWKTAGLPSGTYRFSIWARDANSSGVYGNSAGRWDAYDNSTTYRLTSPSCSAVTVTIAPASPSPAGTKVTVTAHATGCPNPLYHFGVMAPNGTGYSLAQDYSTSATYTWDTTGLAPGTYRFSVWARDANSAGTQGNSLGRWDAYNNDTTYSVS